MRTMRRRAEAGLFFLAIFVLLVFQFRGQLMPGHYLFLSQVEDPAPRFSFFPWHYLAAQELRASHFPLWNPFSGTGMPLIANYQSAVFFPLSWLYYFFSSPRALDLMVLLRLSLAGTFTFLLARRLGLSRLGSALAGVGFALSGYFMKHHNVVNVNSEMWLPLLLVWIHRGYFFGASQRGLILSGLVWAMVFCGGSPEAGFYVFFVAGLFALAFYSGLKKLLAAFLVPAVLGALVAAVQILPFLEYLPRSWHLHDPSLHLLGSPSPRQMTSLIAPWLLGPSGSHPSQLLCFPYLGVIIVLLSLLAGLHAQRRRNWFFWAGSAALLLALAYRLPPLSFLTYLPPLNRFAHAKFALVGVNLAVAILAGGGLDLVRAERINGKKTALALALLGLLLLGGTFYTRWQFQTIVLGGFLVPFLALLLASALLALVLSQKRESGNGGGKKIAYLLAGFCLLELMLLSLGFRRESEMNPALLRFPEPETPEAFSLIKKDPTRPRFTGLSGALHHNLNLLYGVFDLRAFDGIYPRNYVRAMGEIEGFALSRAAENFMTHGWSFDVRPENLGHPLVDVLGVKFVVSREEINVPSSPGPRSSFLVPGGSAWGFVLVHEGAYRVYENPESFPRAWVMPGKSENEELVKPEGEQSMVQVVSYSWDRVELVAHGPGELILTDTCFPGWRAEVNGAERPLRPYHSLFRSLRMEPGEQKITMTYQPWGFRIGLFVSLVSLVGGGARLLWGKSRIQ